MAQNGAQLYTEFGQYWPLPHVSAEKWVLQFVFV